MCLDEKQTSTLVTSNLPFNEWTEVFGSERLTGALLDRLTHHVPHFGAERRQLSSRTQQARPPRRCRSCVLTPPPATPLPVQPGFHSQARRPPAGRSTLPPPPWSNFGPPLTGGVMPPVVSESLLSTRVRPAIAGAGRLLLA